jgi:hypothetical protein
MRNGFSSGRTFAFTGTARTVPPVTQARSASINDMIEYLENKKIRWIVCPLLFFLSIVILILAPRIMGLVIFTFTVLMYISYFLHRKSSLIIIPWILFLICIAMPFDISLRNLPGPPRVVKYIVGYPSNQGFEMIQKGEAISGGCISMGYDPIWVLVW